MPVNSTFDGITYIVAPGEVFCSNTLINNARVSVRSGAVVKADRLSAGGSEYVSVGGITSGAVILSGGKVTAGGGTALDAQVSSGGSLYGRTISGNCGYVSRAQIFTGGKMYIYDSAAVQGTVIRSGGYAKICGSALDTVISSGGSMHVYNSCGYASHTVVSGFGRVYDGGLMSDTTIASGGSFHLWRGGILKDVEIQSGGLLDLRESAPVLTGDVLVAGQLKASYDQNVNASGAKITVDLTSRTAADDYSIVNFDYLGDTSLAITVSADQAAGIYKIASNAAAWKSAINLTVQGETGAPAALSFGTAEILNGKNYTLSKGEKNRIILSIANIAVIDDKDFPVMQTYSERGPYSFGLGKVSEFTLNNGTLKSGFVGCISGITQADWQPCTENARLYVFYHDKIYDAEKNDLVSIDDMWCGQMTDVNMLTWVNALNHAGYQDGDELVRELIANDDADVSPGNYLLGKTGIAWGSWCSFDRSEGKTCFDWLKQADAYLRNGCIAWYEVNHGTPDNITGGHARTLLGLIYNTDYSPDDPRYYSGIVVADSDDTKKGYDNAADSPNRIYIEKIEWDDELQSYWSKNGQDYMINVWAYRPVPASGAADLTWYQPNEWSTQMTVNTFSGATHDSPVLRSDDELLLSFAITNQGGSDTPKFYVSLYVDDVLQETFTVNTLASQQNAAFTDYRLGCLAAGTHTIRAVIDPYDCVTEEYETNNVYSKTILVTPAGEARTVSSGGGFVVSAGNSIRNLSIQSGARVHVRGKGAEMENSVIDGGLLTVSSGAAALHNTLIGNARAAVSSGGKVIGNDISAGADEDVFTGGLTSSAVILSGGRVLLAGGTALDTQVSSGGGLYVRLHSGNLSYASRAQIYSGGFMDVYNSSTAQGTVIHSGGYVRIRDYGSALDTVIESGASMYVQSSCGYASHTVISGFGRVYDGGLMSDTTIASGGSFHLWRGGILKDVEIQSGGLLDLRESAPVLTGDVLVAGQLKASYDQNVNASGAKITVDLSSRTAADDYSIVNLDYLGDTSLAITVSADQAAGNYRIASRAGNWSDAVSLTVQGASGKPVSLRCGTSQTLAGKDYTLTGNNGNLLLSVASTAVPEPSGLSGSSSGLSWKGSSAAGYSVCLMLEHDTHTLEFTTGKTAIDLYAMPAGSYAWQVGNAGSETRVNGNCITAEAHVFPAELVSDADGDGDIFFGNAAGTWSGKYAARHVGSGDWQGTGERVSLAGKNRITDIFAGSADADILLLTDDADGDALFVDDIYSAFPDEQRSRIAQLDEIRAGAGDDIVDMTSRRFAYSGDGLTVRGGSGNDTIWANKNSNRLFGDAGDDRIVGAAGDDMIAGGVGNDSMHGGGGDDLFCFCSDWGNDTVEQLAGGRVTLWFVSAGGTWDEASMTYTQGGNTVTVTGTSDVVLKYGSDGSEQYRELAAAGAFTDASSCRIFEEKNEGIAVTLATWS